MYFRGFHRVAKDTKIDGLNSSQRGRISMMDPFEVLRFKEQELARVKKEVDALRIVAQVLGEETNGKRIESRPGNGTSSVAATAS
jgi:hypothetical protein